MARWWTLGLPESQVAATSGLIELAIDRAEDEPGGLGTLPAEVLALVLLERQHQVGEVLVHRRRPQEVTGGERGVQSGDDAPRVVYHVALGADQLADVAPRRVRGGTRRAHRQRPIVRRSRSEAPAPTASGRSAGSSSPATPTAA